VSYCEFTVYPDIRIIFFESQKAKIVRSNPDVEIIKIHAFFIVNPTFGDSCAHLCDRSQRREKEEKKSTRMSGEGANVVPKQKKCLNDFFSKETDEQRARRLQSQLSPLDAAEQQLQIANARNARQRRQFQEAFQHVRARDEEARRDAADDAEVLRPFRGARGVGKTFEKKTTYTDEFSRTYI
jgi:hypothetical protein